MAIVSAPRIHARFCGRRPRRDRQPAALFRQIRRLSSLLIFARSPCWFSRWSPPCSGLRRIVLSRTFPLGARCCSPQPWPCRISCTSGPGTGELAPAISCRFAYDFIGKNFHSNGGYFIDSQWFPMVGTGLAVAGVLWLLGRNRTAGPAFNFGSSCRGGSLFYSTRAVITTAPVPATAWFRASRSPCSWGSASPPCTAGSGVRPWCSAG